MNIFQLDVVQTKIAADVVFMIGEFPVTNSVITSLVVTALLVLFLLVINLQGFKQYPSKLQVFVESTVEGMLSFIAQIVGSRETALMVLPVVGTLFVYIAAMNLFTTFVPFLDAVQYQGVSVFRTPTSDFNVTVSMAISMVLLAHFFSIRKKNIFGYLGSYFRVGGVIRGFSKGIGQGFIAIVEAMVGLLDIISEIAKVVSLSLRLFGNMFAGVVVLGVLLGLFALLLPIPAIGLGILAGALQAIVFGALVSSYFMSALQD